MVRVKPFRGLRPPPEMAAAVSAPPYDVINSDEARELMKTAGETSFLRVNKPEVDLPPEINQYDVYERGRQNLRKFLENGWLVPDKTPCFYVYSQKMGDHLQTGIVAGVPVEDYAMGIIKRHEKTQVKKENDRTRLTHTQNANAGPVFLTYRTNEGVDEVVKKITSADPEVHFRAGDGTEHAVWPVRDPVDVFAIQGAFESVKATYIADGHHRSASAFRVGEMKIKEAVARGDVVTGEEPFNFFLAVLFPSNQLLCMEYNRVVRDLAGFSVRLLLLRVAVKFDVSKTPEGSKVEPDCVREVAMCLRGDWYMLRAKDGTYPADDPVRSLDVQILYDNLLNPVLNIGNPRADERIKYDPNAYSFSRVVLSEKTFPLPEVSALWYSSMLCSSRSIAQVMRVADAEQLMPPKATWFEPKLRSGLVVRSLDETR
ncbi:unnamed protein product [Scytosiphon promiscuus]